MIMSEYSDGKDTFLKNIYINEQIIQLKMVETKFSFFFYVNFKEYVKFQKSALYMIPLKDEEKIKNSQLLPLTLALSNSWQLLADASRATPAEPTPRGRQLCKSQIKHNLYSSQHVSTVICVMCCPGQLNVVLQLWDV